MDRSQTICPRESANYGHPKEPSLKNSETFWLHKNPTSCKNTNSGGHHLKRKLYSQLPHLCISKMVPMENARTSPTNGKTQSPLEGNLNRLYSGVAVKLGNTVIWVITDVFSKQVPYMLCQKIPSACSLARLLMQYV